MLRTLLKSLPTLLESLNKTPIRRVIVYMMLLFPVFVVTTYREEIGYLLAPVNKNVAINNIAEAQERCFRLRHKYNVEAVLVYIYQPAGKNKNYKERIVFSTETYKPMSSMKVINLFSRSNITHDLNTKGYCIITSLSGHAESAIIAYSKLTNAIITPIKDNDTNELIGEVAWLFQETTEEKIETIISEGQIFAHDLTINL